MENFEKRIRVVLHRWNSLCALLMFNNPHFGASRMAISLGQYFPYKKGWNTSLTGGRRKYIFIDVEYGYTTEIKPSIPDSQIYETKDDFHFSHSEAEKILNSIPYHLLGLTKGKGYNSDFLQESIDKIDRNKSIIYNYVFNKNEVIDKEIKNLYLPLQNKLFNSVKSNNKNFDDATLAANNIVDDYLNFEISGQVAVQTIDFFIRAIIKITVNLIPIEQTKVEIIETNFFKREVEYLHDKIYELLTEVRTEYDLSSFYKITYLAILYGKIATNLIEYLMEVNSQERNSDSWSRNKNRAIEELIVHQGTETFLYPALLIPYSAESFYKSTLILNSRSIKYVYPQIEKESISPKELTKVFDALEKFNENKQYFDIRESLYTKQNPVIDPRIMTDLYFNSSII